ncbi:MAG: trehalose-6-phosphate synthase [Proteobacteria bacterium]|nr:trehalose-6-phosphate synthase [Pseudomonadota bacterium]
MRAVRSRWRGWLLRFVLPVAVAVSLIAVAGVPLLDRMLSGWFRGDVQLRAHLLMNSMQAPLAELVARHDLVQGEAYLNRVAADERLLGIEVCDSAGHELMKSSSWPKLVPCASASASPETTQVQPDGHAALDISSFAVDTPASGRLWVSLAHDLSFIDRRQSIARRYLIAFVLVLVSALALLAALVVRVVVGRWVRLLIGDIRNRRFVDDAASPSLVLPLLSRIRQTLREVEAQQRLEIDYRENWTPQALQHLAREYLEDTPILVVSNREPYIHNRAADGSIQLQLPASGMVTALEPVVRACHGTWIAHGSGTADRETVDAHDRLAVPPDEPAYTLRRVWLSDEEEAGYYYGFSNEGLWPLCHQAYVRPAFREQDWIEYQRVNRRFAEVVEAEARGSQPVVLLQDFHLALLPAYLRERLRRATIAHFWHVPWPNAETFGVCPWKQELLHSLLATDVLGFHTRYHCLNFLDSVDRYVECQIDREQMTVTLRGHVCKVTPYPISIEWPPRWLAGLPAADAAREAIRKRYGLGKDVRIGIGVERWDFTKGIIERVQALERLLERHREWRGRVTLLQVAAPSRSRLPAYQALQQQTIASVEHVNQRFGTADWQPVVLIAEHQEPKMVYTLYRAADFCVVNSLHDGMNLVAKEFVAARDDLDGVLILSTFAGASRELLEALPVNPFDVGETADAIVAALQMGRAERLERMRLMRRTIKGHNVYRWAGRMLTDVVQIRQRQTLRALRAAS